MRLLDGLGSRRVWFCGFRKRQATVWLPGYGAERVHSARMSDASRESKGGWKTVIITAIISASPPITAATYTWLSREKELEVAQRQQTYKLMLEKTQQDYSMRTGFLDRAVDPARSPRDRQLVLRFLSSVADDEPLRHWANQELQDVESQLKEARQRISILEEQASNWGQEVVRLRAALAEAQSEATTRAQSRAQIEELSEKLREAERQLKDTRAEASEVRTELKPDTLSAERKRKSAELDRYLLPQFTTAAEKHTKH